MKEESEKQERDKRRVTTKKVNLTQKLLKKIKKNESNVNVMNAEYVNHVLNEVTYSSGVLNSTTFATHPNFNKTKFVGVHSRKAFFDKYKEFPIIQRKNIIPPQSTSFKFIKSSRENHIVPNPLGIIHSRGNEGILDLTSARVGDRFMNVMAESLTVNRSFNVINLDSCRLTIDSIQSLHKTMQMNSDLSQRIVRLSLNHNRIGLNGLAIITSMIKDNNCFFSELELADTGINDLSVIRLCEIGKIYLKNQLKLLNLSQNNLSDRIAQPLSEFANECYMLKSLTLRENRLGDKGCAILIRNLAEHYELKVLDLSWNSIGENLVYRYNQITLDNQKKIKRNVFNMYTDHFKSQKRINFKKKITDKPTFVPNRFVYELCKYFESEKVNLYHLDISNNNISFADCKQIEDAVRANHTILGLHVNNNAMEVDELGFVKAHDLEEDDTFAKTQINYNITDEKALYHTNFENIRKLRMQNNCWICEGWRELKFTYKPSNEFFHEMVKVQLHLEIDNYFPTDTHYERYEFVAYRMCPPGEVNYFFTANNKPVLDYGINSKELTEELVINYDDEVEDGVFDKVQVELKQLGSLINETNEEVLSKDFTKQIRYCIPRPAKVFEEKVRVKTPWKFETSWWYVCNRYLFDGESKEHIKMCFENDFNLCNFIKDAKNDQTLEEMKTFLLKNYIPIVNTYKLLSVSDSGAWQVYQSVLIEFMRGCNDLVDGKIFAQNDMLLQMTAIIAFDKMEKIPNLSDNLLRHQFFKMLVKTVKERYINREKKFKNIMEALEYGFNENYKAIYQFNPQEWRKEQYYNEEIEYFILAFQSLLEAVYCSWSSIKTPGKKYQPMNMYEFKSLCEKIVYADFPIRDISLFFNISKRIQIDEINSDAHNFLSFSEFVEAFVRVIDKLSPIPQGQAFENWPMQKRTSLKLIEKLENAIPLIQSLITNPEYKVLKEKFVIPEKDEYGLFKTDVNLGIPVPKVNERGFFLT